MASLCLSGCVAAVIPLVASGAIAQSEKNGGVNSEPREAAKELTPESDAMAPDASSVSSTDLATNTLAEQQPTPAADRSIQSPRLAEFIRYSTQQAFRFSEVEEPLASAVLRNPASLKADRIECEPDDELDPAVLIDLDPGENNFSSASPLPTSTSIALSLKVLRSEGVTIAWISGNSAAEADIVRDALTSSGLDPNAEDTLLLMRYPGDRKQTRRKEFASENCLIAIAGDNRRDFDELYNYLNNRDTAFRLEKLINNGWFLIGPDTPAGASSRDADDPIAQTEIDTPVDATQTETPSLPDPDGKQD
ncbi:hypothetical protein [Erythrobacter sp. F6033]|uniref:hypothetical protein n=1 Tax=Erythrobacter sp. F6033 TaxID=2926401 RepID=UPI001FF0E006|nr:hypothetical protein [Erythrobacter sp. F6033]MCK0127125.1 hypothetical protein [Erythrobacter sp. F6033]